MAPGAVNGKPIENWEEWKKIGQIQDKIRKIEMSNLPENEKVKLIEPLETMLDSLRRASATL